MTPYQKKLLAFLSVATFFEGYDFFALTQVLPHLRTEFALDHAQAAALLGVVNLGTVLAYLVIGLGDRLGRKRLLTITILGYASFTALSGLAPDVISFAIFQLLARIFLIGEWATSMVIAAEEFPAKKRGLALGVVGAMAGLGSVLCVGVVPALTANFGWRSVYLVGVVPLLLLAYARRGLKETDRFAESQKAAASQKEAGSQNAAEKGPGLFRQLYQSPYKKRVFQMGFIWFLTYLATQNAVAVWKDYAMTELLMTEKAASGIMTVAALIALPVAFLSGPLIDWLGRKPGAAIILLLTSLGILGSYTLRHPLLLGLSLTFCVVGVSAVLTVFNAFTTELFPTKFRGSAFALSNNILGRTGYWLSPFVVGQIALTTGWGAPLRWTAVFPIFALFFVYRWLPETKGKELEELTQ